MREAKPVIPPIAGRSAILALVAICGLALILRVGAIALVGPVQDIAGYTESGLVAQNLVRGQGYTFDFFGLRTGNALRAFMPPLFVGLLYLCLRLSSQPAVLFAVVQAVFSTLVCIAVYWIAMELSGKRSVALLSALATACYPVLVLMVTVPVSLTLHLTILAWALALTTTLTRRPAWGWAVAAGALWGIAVLGRPALASFLPLVVLWLWWNRGTNRGWLRSSVFLVGAAVLLVIPWTVRNYRTLGHFVPVSTNGGFVFWNGNNPFTAGGGHDVYTAQLDQYLGRPHDPAQPAIRQVYPYPLPPEIQARVATMDEVALDRELLRAGLSFIKTQPRAWLALIGQKLIGFWWFRTNIGTAYEASWTRYYKPVYIAVLVFVVAGLVVSAGEWRRYSILYLLFLSYTLTSAAFEVQTRYRWEIEPFFLIFAALYLVTVSATLRASLPSYRSTAAN
jgi:hypothetical protein